MSPVEKILEATTKLHGVGGKVLLVLDENGYAHVNQRGAKIDSAVSTHVFRRMYCAVNQTNTGNPLTIVPDIGQKVMQQT